MRILRYETTQSQLMKWASPLRAVVRQRTAGSAAHQAISGAHQRREVLHAPGEEVGALAIRFRRCDPRAPVREANKRRAEQLQQCTPEVRVAGKHEFPGKLNLSLV